MRGQSNRRGWSGRDFKVFLAELRAIGWSEWDPIGLSSHRSHCEDEYDSYLLAACGKLIHGIPEDRVVAYLVRIEAQHIGITGSDDSETRARKTIRCLADLLKD